MMNMRESQYKANRKYDKKAYKSITVRIPRAIEEDVNKKVGDGSLNGYIIGLIKKDLGIKDAE